jgi:hypothetical protein
LLFYSHPGSDHAGGIITADLHITGEKVCIIGDVYAHPGVRELLEGLTVKQETTKLRGILFD